MALHKCYPLVLFLLLLPGLACANSNPWERKLPFKSATISYVLSGSETGTETLYIREYGKESAKYRKSSISMMGTTTTTDSLEIENPDWLYDFDLTARTGVKTVNPQKYMIEEYQKLSAAEKKQLEANIQAMGLPTSETMGAKIEQKATKILGFDCDKVEMMGTTVYSIHNTGIPLKMEMNMMGMTMKHEATKVDEGSVDGKHFAPPTGIEVTTDPEADTLARSFAQQTIATLKSPDGVKKMQEQGGHPMMMPQAEGQPEMTPEEKKEMEEAMEMLKGMMGNQK